VIAQKDAEEYVEYHEDGYWIELPKRRDTPSSARRQPHLYHHCPMGRECNILLEEETRSKECYQCGRVDIPDGLWTLYVLLDGRGVY
jgi:hypothetical protein